MDVQSGKLDPAHYAALTGKVLAEFPEPENDCGHAARIAQRFAQRLVGLPERRQSVSWLSRHYEITHIVDRVGGGDAFAGGLIYGLQALEGPQEALEFAVAASCLKHSIPGDFNRFSVDEVRQLIKGGGSGRVQR